MLTASQRQKQGLQASHPVLDNCGERASLYWRMWQLLPLPSDLRLTSLQYMLKPWSPRLSWDWAVSKLPNLILVRIHWLNPDWGTLTSNQSDMCKNVCVIKTRKEWGVSPMRGNWGTKTTKYRAGSWNGRQLVGGSRVQIKSKVYIGYARCVCVCITHTKEPLLSLLNLSVCVYLVCVRIYRD